MRVTEGPNAVECTQSQTPPHADLSLSSSSRWTLLQPEHETATPASSFFDVSTPDSQSGAVTSHAAEESRAEVAGGHPQLRSRAELRDVHAPEGPCGDDVWALSECSLRERRRRDDVSLLLKPRGELCDWARCRDHPLLRSRADFLHCGVVRRCCRGEEKRGEEEGEEDDDEGTSSHSGFSTWSIEFVMFYFMGPRHRCPFRENIPSDVSDDLSSTSSCAIATSILQTSLNDWDGQISVEKYNNNNNNSDNNNEDYEEDEETSSKYSNEGHEDERWVIFPFFHMTFLPLVLKRTILPITEDRRSSAHSTYSEERDVWSSLLLWVRDMSEMLLTSTFHGLIIFLL